MITSDWNDLGMPIAVSRWTRLVVSWPFTTDPRTATPATAPSSRLVFVIDAAMPECSAGTIERAADVTGTIAIPIPAPATSSVPASGQKPDVGPMTALVARIPAAVRTHPTVIGRRAPAVATQWPVKIDASTMPAAIGAKTSAVAYGDWLPTTCR